MSFNTFGKLFRFTTWGESHGPAIGCVVDGCPPNININESDIRNIIWLSESGVNFRDNKSLKLSDRTKKIYGYTVFKYYLDNFRKDVINKKYDFYKDKKLFIKSHTY